MRSLRTAVVVAVVVLVIPALASAQVKVFNFSWYTECQNRAGTSGDQGSAGIATLTSSANGYQLRFSGPNNLTGSADIIVFSPTDVSIQNISIPNACGIRQDAPTSLFLRGTLDDPEAFEFDSFFGSNGEGLLAVGVATKTIVVPTISSPANGATVTGTTSVAASVIGVSGGIPLTYHFSVDGAEVAATTSTTLQASVSWDSRTVADGAHALGLAVTDVFGTAVYSSTFVAGVNVANGGSGGTLTVAVTSPHDGDTVAGTSWAVIWVNGGTSGASYTYTLQLDGQTVAMSTTTSTGPVSMPWDTKAFLNGTHTLNATVRDNAGKTGSAKLGVLIRN